MLIVIVMNAFLFSLLGVRRSSDWHLISSEPSGQWARPSHTIKLDTHFLLSLHKKSSDIKAEVHSQTADIMDHHHHQVIVPHLCFDTGTHTLVHQNHQDSLSGCHTVDSQRCKLTNPGRGQREQCMLVWLCWQEVLVFQQQQVLEKLKIIWC